MREHIVTTIEEAHGLLDSEDDKKLALAYRVISSELERYLRSRGAKPIDSENCAAEATEQVVLHFKRFQSRGSGSFTGWCQRIAKNRFLNHLRSQDREQTHDAMFWDSAATDESDSDDAESYDENAPHSMAQKAWQALLHLDSRSRQVLVLRAVDELDFAQIAEKVGVSVPNARQIYRRAKNELAELSQHFAPASTEISR